MARTKTSPTPNGLFAEPEGLKPLAERMRPRTLGEVVGQPRLVDANTPLRRAIEAGHVHSMILWGPPGCGKTTLALLLARYADAEFQAISAVMSGLPDVRKALAEAEARWTQGTRTVLFVDEVHRFNKVQQDAFLPYIERGVIVFVGATTENPSFELNSALLALPRARARCGVRGCDRRSLASRARGCRARTRRARLARRRCRARRDGAGRRRRCAPRTHVPGNRRRTRP
jgi:putative ATPase